MLALCGATVPLTSILPVPLLPELPALLHTSLPAASWALTATLLSAAVCTPIAGRAGDQYGKSLILAASLGALIGGSLLCGLADSLAVLVAGRALQGCAAGALPLSYGILRDVMPAGRLAPALAAMSAAVGAIGAAGFPLVAVAARSAGWHVPFLLAAALGVTELLLVLAVVPVSRPGAESGRFDVAGAAALAAGLGCMLLTVTNGRGWGWTSDVTLATAGAAVAGLAVWWRIEVVVPCPLVDLRIMFSRTMLAANIAALLIGFAMYALSVIVPELLRVPVRSGACLAASGAAMMLLAPTAAWVLSRRGAGRTLAAGATAIGCGYAAAAVLPSDGSLVVAATLVVGGSLAFTFAAMPALVLDAVPASESAAANGMNLLIRSVGATVSSAVLVTVLGTMTTTAPAAGNRVTVPSGTAFRVAFCIASGAALAGAAVAAWSGQRRDTAAARRSSLSSPA